MGCWLSVILGSRPWPPVVHFDKRKQPGRLPALASCCCVVAGRACPLALCNISCLSKVLGEGTGSPFQDITVVCRMPCFLLCHTVTFLMSVTFYDTASYVFQPHLNINIFSIHFNLPFIPSSWKDRAGQPGNGTPGFWLKCNPLIHHRIMGELYEF